jgi:hypothetical protein
VLRYNVGVLRSNLPDWLKLVLVFLVAYLVWKLLKPTAVLPKTTFPGRFLPAYLGTRVGTERGGKDADDDAGEKQPGPGGIPPSGPQRQHPVHSPAAVPTPSEPLFIAASRTPAYAGEPLPGVALRGGGRGTFAPREQPVAGLPSADVARAAREVSGAVEGRVLDRETAMPAVVDDSNLTYDSAGERVFVVFTPARSLAEQGSFVES